VIVANEEDLAAEPTSGFRLVGRLDGAEAFDAVTAVERNLAGQFLLRECLQLLKKLLTGHYDASVYLTSISSGSPAAGTNGCIGTFCPT
jgi:hypothetical protein